MGVRPNELDVHVVPHADGDPRRWFALAVLLTGAFLPRLDFNVVNLALPAIRNSLGASSSAVQFVISAYAAAYAVFLVVLLTLGNLGKPNLRSSFQRKPQVLFNSECWSSSDFKRLKPTAPDFRFRRNDEQSVGERASSEASLGNKASSAAARHDLVSRVAAAIRTYRPRIRSPHVSNDSTNGIDLDGLSGYFLQAISRGFMRLVNAPTIAHFFACARSGQPSITLVQSVGRRTDITDTFRCLASPFIPWSAFKC
jgi:hypothetical protein